jgi:acyl dehydratase
MSGRFFEDIKAGERFQSAEYHVTEEQIVTFAREWNPQSFHLPLS